MADTPRLRDILPASPRAVFGRCGNYRYVLWRECTLLDAHFDSRYALFIGLNPSTADAFVDDPTVRRETRFCQRWGYGRMCKVNLFGYRATDPKAMKAQPDPNGPDNDYWIDEMARKAALIVLAWGNGGAHLGRATQVLELLRPYADRWFCLGTTRTGEPRHPLYVKAATPLIRYLSHPPETTLHE